MSSIYRESTRALRNDRFLRALKRQPVDRTPVWMMRQAGRYLPEYRASRAKAADFMALCRNAELCCEVTLQPLARFPGLDAAILFSDILTIPDAMGLGLSFKEGHGPVFERTVRSKADILALPTPDVETELGYVMNAVRTIRGALGDRLPLIGFTGSPWTLATYMIEGRGKTEFAHAKRWAFDAPEEMDLLLDRLGGVVADYLLAQIAAGADAVMIFDTWGGVLPHTQYRSHSARSMFEIVRRVKAAHPEVPVILYTKGGGPQLGWLAEHSGADALGTDWTVNLADARVATRGRVALQGNLDPQILLAGPERVRAETRRVLAEYGAGPGHVFNLGHGILPQTPPEHAGVMIETVARESAAYHRAH